MHSRSATGALLAVSLLLINADTNAEQNASQENASGTGDRFDSLREQVKGLVDSGEVPSISIAVAHSGTIIWEESFGWANRETLAKATPHTLYSLASVSKTITATAVMTLVHDGKLDLDAAVNSYIAPSRLTAYEGDSDDITIRHLLHHTSGLPLHCSLYRVDRSSAIPSIEEMIARYGIAVHPAGEVYEYSNLGYGILGHVVARITGESFGDYVKTTVFLPLGMLHSSMNIGPGLGDYAAARYDGNNQPIPFYDSNHRGASCFYSSAHDMIRFAMFHLQDGLADQVQILPEAILDQMHSERDPSLPKTSDEYYAYGMVTALDENGYRILSHDGGMPGVSTTFDLVPDEDLAIVILMNCSDSVLYELRSRLLGILLPGYAKESAREKSENDARDEESIALASLKGEWEGTVKTYERDVPISMQFQEDGDILVTLKSSPLDSVCPRKLNRVSFRDGCLLGVFNASLPTGDALADRHYCVLKVYERHDRMVGFVAAILEDGYTDLSSYVHFERKTD